MEPMWDPNDLFDFPTESIVKMESDDNSPPSSPPIDDSFFFESASAFKSLPALTSSPKGRDSKLLALEAGPFALGAVDWSSDDAIRRSRSSSPMPVTPNILTTDQLTLPPLDDPLSPTSSSSSSILAPADCVTETILVKSESQPTPVQPMLNTVTTTTESVVKVESGARPKKAVAAHKKTQKTTGSRKRRAPASVSNGDPKQKQSKRERNKISASKYRKRRKLYFQGLESKVNVMTATIDEQKQTIEKLGAANQQLSEQVILFRKLFTVYGLDKPAAQLEAVVRQQAAIAQNTSTGDASGAVRLDGASQESPSTFRSKAGMVMFALFACLIFGTSAPFAAEENPYAVSGRRGRALLSFQPSSAYAEELGEQFWEQDMYKYWSQASGDLQRPMEQEKYEPMSVSMSTTASSVDHLVRMSEEAYESALGMVSSPAAASAHAVLNNSTAADAKSVASGDNFELLHQKYLNSVTELNMLGASQRNKMDRDSITDLLDSTSPKPAQPFAADMLERIQSSLSQLTSQ